MPELPDIVSYVEALERRIAGKRLDRLSLLSAFVLRSVEPPIEAINGMSVAGVSRIGKRVVVAFDGDLFLVMHLMIAGRLRWREPGEKPGVGTKRLLAVFEFENGRLLFTEASSRKRASITLVRGRTALAALNPGGIGPLDVRLEAFRAPLKLSRSLTDDESERLYVAVRATLALWIQRFREETAERFPEKVTAFRPDMAVHGRFRQPCPVCGTPVQRMVYAANECNYCARCQTGGKLVADRSLSRLLKEDWPRSIDEL